MAGAVRVCWAAGAAEHGPARAAGGTAPAPPFMAEVEWQ